MIQKIRQDINIGNNLRVLRKKSGLSQEKLCVELQRIDCDIGRSTYAKYESGELNIKISVLKALKSVYQCEYNDFLRLSNFYFRPVWRTILLYCLTYNCIQI